MAVVLVGGLVLTSIGCGAFVVAARTGAAPEFDRQIALDARHILVVHNGASSTCTTIPNPPQHDCFVPGPERREFAVYYLTSHGVRSLLWFRLQ